MHNNNQLSRSIFLNAAVQTHYWSRHNKLQHSKSFVALGKKILQLLNNNIFLIYRLCNKQNY